MLNYDYTKEYSLPIDTSLKTMRIRLSPSIELEYENMYVVDMLEESGVFRIMEHIGNTLCISSFLCCRISFLIIVLPVF